MFIQSFKKLKKKKTPKNVTPNLNIAENEKT